MQLEHYVHVLLFACPKCGSPIASTCLKKKETWKLLTQSCTCLRAIVGGGDRAWEPPPRSTG